MQESDVISRVTEIIQSLSTNPLSKKESQEIEFKENIQSEHYARYAKSLASFANNKGGMIIFGVKSSPYQPIGTVTYRSFNRDRFGRILEKFFSPLLDWQMTVIEVSDQLHFPVIYIVGRPEELYVCLDENSGEGMHKGEIYYRYHSENKRIAPHELQKNLSKIKEAERNAVISKMNVIANSNPRDLLIANLAKGTLPELEGKLLIDERVARDLRFIQEGRLKERGKPVLKVVSSVQQVKVRPTKPGSGGVPIELTEQNYRQFFPYTHDQIIEALKKKKRGFMQNAKYNSLKIDLRRRHENELAYHRTLRSPDEPGMWFYSDEFINKLFALLEERSSDQTKLGLEKRGRARRRENRVQ